jgi:hypothetical protein
MKHIVKVNIGKHLSESFPIQNGLKHGDVLSPLLLNFALEYAIRRPSRTRLAEVEWDTSASVVCG